MLYHMYVSLHTMIEHCHMRMPCILTKNALLKITGSYYCNAMISFRLIYHKDVYKMQNNLK